MISLKKKRLQFNTPNPNQHVDRIFLKSTPCCRNFNACAGDHTGVDCSQKIGENTVRKLEVVVIMVCLTFVFTKFSCAISRIAVAFYFEKHREVMASETHVNNFAILIMMISLALD